MASGNQNSKWTTNGEVLATGDYLSHKIDLGVASHNEDYFYISSYALSYVYVKFPDTALVRVANSDTPQSVKLIPSNSPAPGMLSAPRRQPPATLPPNPTK